MVKKIFFLFCLLSSELVQAQVCIPDHTILAEFKSTQTAILIDNTRKVRSAVDMKTIISECWDVTTPIIDKEAALAKYKKPGYSVLRVERIEKQVPDPPASNGMSTTHTVVFNYLRLVIFQEKKKGKIKEELVGHIYIGDNIKMTDGLFKAYLKMFNTYLKQGETWPETKLNYVDSKIADLRNQTLYIPGYAFNELGENSDSRAKRKDSKKFLQKYDYKAEVEEQKQIDQRILNNEDVYFLLFFYFAEGDKCISVVNAKTGEIVYCHIAFFRKADPTLKPGDLNKLSSAIKNGKKDDKEDKDEDE
jgi:hypothetical protein